MPIKQFKICSILLTCLFAQQYVLSQIDTWEGNRYNLFFQNSLNSPIQKPGYVLVFNDEFNGPTFNDNCWSRENYPYPGLHNVYVDNLWHVPNPGEENYNFSNGKLQLIARHNATIPSTMDSASPLHGLPTYNYSYTSASFKSKDEFKHGLFEMRCKLPEGNNFLPAFWLFASGSSYVNKDRDGDEIDIFEIYGNSTQEHISTYHFTSNQSYLPFYGAWKPSDGLTANGRYKYASAKHIFTHPATQYFSDEYHTFTLEWRTNRIDFFIDNKWIRTVEECHVPESFMNIIANLAVAQFNHGASTGPRPSDFPASLDIDYIRVYKKIEVEDFAYDLGWDATKHRRMIGDIDGDGKDDIVGFGSSQVMVSLGKTDLAGAGFRPANATISDFCYAQGWRVDKHPVYLADANGDGKDDIIGFGGAGVFVALSNTPIGAITPSFQAPTLWYAGFGNDFSSGDFNMVDHYRTIGDINGDGKTDVIAFGDIGVEVATSTGSGYTSSGSVILSNFGTFPSAGGWRTDIHRRFVTDVTGDGKDDIVGFGSSTVLVSVSNGSTFGLPYSTLNNFCYSQGWRLDKHPIFMEDINGDGRKDIVGLGDGGVYAAIAKSTPGFYPSKTRLANYFGYSQAAGSWRTDKHIRTMGDVNGDGKSDLVGYGPDGVYVSFAQPDKSFSVPEYTFNEFGYDNYTGSASSWMGGWRVDKHPRVLADYNGDGRKDFVAFGNEGVFAHLSSFNCVYTQPHRRLGGNSTTTTIEALEEQPQTQSTDRLVYPNPADHTLYFDETLVGKTMRIYDLNGKLMITQKLTTGNAEIDLQPLKAGIYFVRSNEDESFNKKIVVVH